MWISGTKTIVVTEDREVPSAGLPPLVTFRGLPSTPAVPIAVDSFAFFLVMARTSLLRTSQAHLMQERIGLMVLFHRYFHPTNAQLLLTWPLPRTRVPFVDYLRSSFSGRLGYAISMLFLQMKGYILFAHMEEVESQPWFSTTSTVRTYRKLPKSKRPTPIGTPDMLALHSRGYLSFVECKGSLYATNAEMQREKVHKPYQRQLSPWFGSKLGPWSIDHGYVIATRLNEVQGAEIFAAHTDISTPSRSSNINTVGRPIIISHYTPWLMLMGGRFLRMAQELNEELVEDIPDIEEHTVEDDEGRIYVVVVPTMISAAWPQPQVNMFIGIRSDILNYIFDLVRADTPDTSDFIASQLIQTIQTYSDERKSNAEGQYVFSSSVNNNQTIIFPDGTFGQLGVTI